MIPGMVAAGQLMTLTLTTVSTTSTIAKSFVVVPNGFGRFTDRPLGQEFDGIGVSDAQLAEMIPELGFHRQFCRLVADRGIEQDHALLVPFDEQDLPDLKWRQPAHFPRAEQERFGAEDAEQIG